MEAEKIPQLKGLTKEIIRGLETHAIFQGWTVNASGNFVRIKTPEIGK